MIISISPPSSVSFRNLEKQTKQFWSNACFIKRKNCELLAKSSACMILLKKQELLMSFNSDDDVTISLLQKYLTSLFKDVFVVVDLENPVTQNLKFVINLPREVLS